MAIPEDPSRFFQDLLFRQGLLIPSSFPDTSTQSISPPFEDPISLLSRDQLVTLWQSCVCDESPSDRLHKAVRLFLREKALLAVSNLHLSVDVPSLPVLRPLGVADAVAFATMTLHDLQQAALNT